MAAFALLFAIVWAIVSCGSSDDSSGAQNGGDSGAGNDASIANGDGSTTSDASSDGGVGEASVFGVTRSFDGDRGDAGAGCGGSPGCQYKDHPDMGIDANGTQVVEVTGQNVMVFDYSGAVLAKTSLAAFITNAGLTAGTLNDPRVSFDPFISRWIVVCSCSADYLMVSATSDATGSWKGVALGVNSGDLTMYPGWDKNGVYVSEYGGNASAYDVVALPANDVAFSGAGTISLTHENTFTNFPFETRPAVDPDPAKAAGAPAYFIARSGPNQNGTNVALNVLVDSVTWSGTTATKQTQHALSSGFLYNTPLASAPQPSTPGLRPTESHRFMSAAMAGSHLHGVVGSGPCASSCGAQGVDAHQLFYWFDVDTTTMTIADSAKVSSPTLDYLFPSLAVDVNGNVGMVATATSASTDPEIVLFSHRTSDAKSAVTGPLVATPGTNVYACGGANPVGWGDYSTTTRDPVDPTKLWAVEEYAASTTACAWQTRILQFTP